MAKTSQRLRANRAAQSALAPGARNSYPDTRLNRTIPLILAVALFMENMDSTVIATSLPAIAADIGTSPVALKLALTSYLVSLAIFIPISGWMADRYGAKRIFRIAIGVFIARLDRLRDVGLAARFRARALRARAWAAR